MTDEKRREFIELVRQEKDFSDLIKKNIPPFLYKYRSGYDWDLNALENNQLWMGNATKMDDPVDSKMLFDNKFLEQVQYLVNYNDRFSSEKYKKILEKDVIQKDCYLCSLSEVSDNSDMWDRYANKERGFCIEYDTVSLIQNVGLPILPVYYDEKEKNNASSISSSSKKKIILLNYLIKNWTGEDGEDWHSQREWRIIGFTKNLEIGETDVNGKCIKAIKPNRIILGKYISCEVKNRILQYAKCNGDLIIDQRK